MIFVISNTNYFIMARRSRSVSRQVVDSIQESLVEYFRDNILDEYEVLTGADLFQALVETFQELEKDLQEELKPIQYVLNKLDPEDTEPQVLKG